MYESGHLCLDEGEKKKKNHKKLKMLNWKGK